MTTKPSRFVGDERAKKQHAGVLLDLVILFAPVILAHSGCYPAYAPPVRTDLSGAPARLAIDQGDVHGSATWPTLHDLGALSAGAGASIPLGMGIHLEGGVSSNPTWFMGHVGVRQSWGDLASDGSGAVFDVEAGGGAGVGGVFYEPDPDCDDCWGMLAGPPWRKRIAGGGYVGGGAGYRVEDAVTPFGRVRFQLTGAQETPTTFWYDVVGGIEGYPRAWGFSLFLAGGITGYANAEDSTAWPSVHFGASLAFPFRDEGGHQAPEW